MLKRFLSQERRTELKRLQGQARKQLAPLLRLVHGSFTTKELMVELERRLPSNFEILMIHSSFDSFLPMYNGNAKDLVRALVDFCGPNRTLVMPSFVMGGRDYDAAAYFQSRPFDIRTTPSDMGIIAEIFRRIPNVRRSLHPTCSVCAIGFHANEVTAEHHLAKTGLGPDGPFGVMSRRHTAILGLGVEYFRCLTHVHNATQTMGDEFPIKFVSRATQVKVVDYNGSVYEQSIGLPDRTKKLDLSILGSVLSKDELVEWRFHGVPMFAIPEAGIVTRRLIEAAGRGITIYGRVAVNENSVATAQ
ncbi:MAG TPA: AAC(3) family N-acetyltransferase [Terracidiphilus sp.]|jgi:aminoglycoside N3'-acetyltransferase